MPTYQYACTQCDERLEAVQSFTDAPLTECPACSGALRKVYTSVGVVFKGSGFYRNDSRGPAKAEGGSAEGTGSGSDKGGSDGAGSDKGSSDKAGSDKGSSDKAGSDKGGADKGKAGAGEGGGSDKAGSGGGSGKGDKPAGGGRGADKGPRKPAPVAASSSGGAGKTG